MVQQLVTCTVKPSTWPNELWAEFTAYRGLAVPADQEDIAATGSLRPGQTSAGFSKSRNLTYQAQHPEQHKHHKDSRSRPPHRQSYPDSVRWPADLVIAKSCRYHSVTPAH